MRATTKARNYASLWLALALCSAPSGWAGRGSPGGEAPFLLEQQYDQETDPKDRVKIAIKLTGVRLKELRTAYRNAAYDKAGELIELYLSAVDRVEESVTEAADMGSSKRAEIQLRQQARELEDVKRSLSVMDQPLVEKAAERVSKLGEKILYNIMNPPRESARQ